MSDSAPGAFPELEAPEAQFCLRVYNGFDSLEVLNELLEAHAVADFAADTKRFLWCNNASCRLYSQTKENMLAMNWKDCSEAAALNHQLTYESVQVQKKIFTTQKTVYPGGKVLTLTITCQPILMRLDDWESPRTMCLMTFTPLAENAGDVVKWRAAEEMVRHVSIVSTVFDMHTESQSFQQAVYQSPKSLSFYSGFDLANKQHKGSPGRNNPILDISVVFDSCCWETSSIPRDEVEAALLQLKIDSAQLTFSCRKTRAHKEGESPKRETWHSISVRPMMSPFSGKLSVIINEYDISTEKIVTTNLSRYRLEQKLLHDFVSAVSHELRTPLNGIIGLVEALQADGTDAKWRRFLPVIRDCSYNLAHQVNNILDVFIVKKEMKLQAGRVSLQYLVENAISLLGDHLNTGVQLHNHVKGQPDVVLECDARRVRQAMLHLLSNAVKFTERGAIAIRAGPGPQPDSVRVEIEDSGPGVTPDMLAAIWEPFRQVDMTATRRTGGSGLGLSIVKGVVEAHGGAVGCDAGPAGSTFWFWIPTRQPAGTLTGSDDRRLRNTLASVLSSDKAGGEAGVQGEEWSKSPSEGSAVSFLDRWPSPSNKYIPPKTRGAPEGEAASERPAPLSMGSLADQPSSVGSAWERARRRPGPGAEEGVCGGVEEPRGSGVRSVRGSADSVATTAKHTDGRQVRGGGEGGQREGVRGGGKEEEEAGSGLSSAAQGSKSGVGGRRDGGGWKGRSRSKGRGGRGAEDEMANVVLTALQMLVAEAEGGKAKRREAGRKGKLWGYEEQKWRDERYEEDRRRDERYEEDRRRDERSDGSVRRREASRGRGGEDSGRWSLHETAGHRVPREQGRGGAMYEKQPKSWSERGRGEAYWDERGCGPGDRYERHSRAPGGHGARDEWDCGVVSEMQGGGWGGRGGRRNAQRHGQSGGAILRCEH